MKPFGGNWVPGHSPNPWQVESDRLGHRNSGLGWGLCVDHHLEFQRPTDHPRGALDARRTGGDLNPRVLHLGFLAELVTG